jgi:hypothetical protein
MPNWGEVLKEIETCPVAPSPSDMVRRKYLNQYHERTSRNVIAYYSGWLQTGPRTGIDVNDMDINGFMTAIHGMDCSKWTF